MRNVADKIGFLPRERELAIEVGKNKPATDTDGDDQHGDKKAEREFKRARRRREFCRIDKIDRKFPMRQRFAEFRCDERMFPIRLKAGLRNGDGPGVVIEQRDGDVLDRKSVV